MAVSHLLARTTQLSNEIQRQRPKAKHDLHRNKHGHTWAPTVQIEIHERQPEIQLDFLSSHTARPHPQAQPLQKNLACANQPLIEVQSRLLLEKPLTRF